MSYRNEKTPSDGQIRVERMSAQYRLEAYTTFSAVASRGPASQNVSEGSSLCVLVCHQAEAEAFAYTPEENSSIRN